MNISYSSLVEYKNCSYLFKLKHIDGIYYFLNTFRNLYGKLLHKYCQNILIDKITVNDAIKKHNRTWKKFCSLYKNSFKSSQELNSCLDLMLCGAEILFGLKNSFSQQFGIYKVIDVEKLLNLEIGSSNIFKGYIDIIIETEDKKQHIIDFKTCNSIFLFKEYEDRIKQYQLTLYKYFYSKQFGLDLNNFETYFCLLELNLNSKKSIVFERISSGNKKIDNCLSWMNGYINLINNKKFIKNRSYCFRYNSVCPYKKICFSER